MPILTNNYGSNPTKISKNIYSYFSICFRYKLPKDFNFEQLSKKNIKEWQSFLDKSSKMTFEQVEKIYKRPSDKNDTFRGEQVIHYGFGEGFRIHGIIEEGQFVVLRLDPNHKFHNK